MGSEDDNLTQTSTLLPYDCFGFMLEKPSLVDKINKNDAASGLALLSSFTDHVLYLPMATVWPSTLNKNLFFRCLRTPNEHAMYPLLPYAIVIGRDSLAPFFDDIYNAAYDDDRDLSMSTMMTEFRHSITSKSCKLDASKKPFTVDLKRNATTTTTIESLLPDNDHVWVLYMTEYKLLSHHDRPFSFFYADVDSGESPVYADLSTDTILIETSQWGTFGTEHNDAIVQDMTDLSLISMAPEYAFRTRREFVHVYMSVADGVGTIPNKSTPEEDGIKLAINLRFSQERICDLSRTPVSGAYTMTPSILHRFFLHQVFGYITAMNCGPPVLVTIKDSKSEIKYQSVDANAYTTLKTLGLHDSQTWTCFVLALVVKIIKRSNPLKYARLTAEITAGDDRFCGCVKGRCAITVCDLYNRSLQKKLALSAEKKWGEHANSGLSYSCITDFNSSGSSFIGTMGAEISQTDTGKDISLKRYATSYITAARLASKQFEHVQLTGTSQAEWINCLLNKLEDMAIYLDKGSHGQNLVGRTNQVKIENALRESAKVIDRYNLGGNYMHIRRSAIMRLNGLLVLLLRTPVWSKMGESLSILSSNFYSCNFKTIQKPTVVIPGIQNALASKQGPPGVIRFEPHKHDENNFSVVSQSSMKLKHVSAFLQQSSSDDGGGSGGGGGEMGFAGGTQDYSADAENNCENLLFGRILPRLCNDQNMPREMMKRVLHTENKKLIVRSFLQQYPRIAKTFAIMDVSSLGIHTWTEFVDRFVCHYLLTLGNYVPSSLSVAAASSSSSSSSGRFVKKLGSLMPLRMYEVRYNDTKKFNPNGDFINPNVLNSDALLVVSRILVSSFVSHKAQGSNSIINAKIAKNTYNGLYSLFTDQAVMEVAPIAAFVYPLRIFTLRPVEFKFEQMVIDLNKLDADDAVLQYLKDHAEEIYTHGVDYTGTTDDQEIMAGLEEYYPEMSELTRRVLTSIFAHFKDPDAFRDAMLNIGKIAATGDGDSTEYVPIVPRESNKRKYPDDDDDDDCGADNVAVVGSGETSYSMSTAFESV